MEDSAWSRTVKLRTKDVNLFRRLRTSRLLEMLQEASIAHTEELGWTRETTLDRGFLWVVAMQQLQVIRMPEYDETVTLRSWPGPMMHVLYPRQYLLEDEEGNALVRGSAIWTLVDTETRAMADPDAHGVVIEGARTGLDYPLPGLVHDEDCDRTSSFTAPFSYCDHNGHMKNTRYLDVAEDLLAGPAEGRELSVVALQYMAEVRMGETVDLLWREDEESAYVVGIKGGERCFRIRLEYR